MEKRTPHCQLSIVKSLIQAGKVYSTFSALAGASALEISFDGMLTIITSLTMQDFYKSMTTHNNHQVWQDVYHAKTPSGEVYIKLTVIDDVLIVSFKEL